MPECASIPVLTFVGPDEGTPDPQMTRQAVESIYESYRSALHTFFGHQAHLRQSVEDLVQEVCERFVRYPPPADLLDPESYVFKVAWNVLNDANRRSWREAATTGLDRDVLDRLVAEQVGGVWAESCETNLGTSEQLQSVLRELPQPVQTALLLHRVDGHTYKEIALQMNISASTVKKYIGQALTHFRNHYGESRRTRSGSDR